ncbi:hypothetical protein LXA43DRAFT_289926 [Ganoderma leucocontextum]|nr:hypothetical protein LXA43DRAFT_289926 [Ganoderma leucocontextum]
MIYYFAITEDFQLVNTNGINCETPPARLLALHRTQRPYITHARISPVAHLKKGDLEIDVILSASASPLELIAAFWATQVQNIPTPDFICVSYPALNEGDVALLTPAQLVNTSSLPGRHSTSSASTTPRPRTSSLLSGQWQSRAVSVVVSGRRRTPQQSGSSATSTACCST